MLTEIAFKGTQDSQIDNEFLPSRQKEGSGRKGYQAKRKPGRKRILDYELIRELREQGLSGAAIGQELGVNENSVNKAMRTMGIATGRHNYRREPLRNGKVRCRICGKRKMANAFNGSVCTQCTYRLVAEKANNDLDRNLRIHFYRLRASAKYRGIPFTLTEAEFKSKYFQQSGRCYYGEEIVLDLRLGQGRSKDQLSADRLQPDGPYSNENVVLTTLSRNAQRKRKDAREYKQKVVSGKISASKKLPGESGVAIEGTHGLGCDSQVNPDLLIPENSPIDLHCQEVSV